MSSYPEKLLAAVRAYWDHGQAKGENSKTPSPAKMDSKGTGQEETQENRQGRRQSPERMVRISGIHPFSSTLRLVRFAYVGCVMRVS
jgi:hypothetical protein